MTELTQIINYIPNINTLHTENSIKPYPKRKRNHYFYLANNECDKLILDLGETKEIVENIKNFAEKYINEVENKVIVLEKNNEFLLIPYTTRFNRKYKKIIYKKFRKLSKAKVFGRHTFLTITYNWKNAFTFKEMRYNFSKKLTELIDRIKKKYHFSFYIKTIEFMPKHKLIHAHILFLNIGFINPKWLTKQLKLLGLGKIKKIKEFRNLENGIWYFFKYLSKSIKNEIENDTLYLSWALNIKTFSWSILINRLLEFTKNNIEKKGFIYIGLEEFKGIVGLISSQEYYNLYGAG
ncbi:MAG: hypothetical protein QXI58_08515 [Candidatus Micrarchaeia archaeon]